MLAPHVITHLFFAVIQFLSGALANGIIVLVTGMDLIKQRKMAPLDLLLCCVAISRICSQIVTFYLILAVLSLVEFWPLAETLILFMFVSESALWLATWLSVFYCAKIVTIVHPFFFWLKLRISKLVPWLIFGSLLYTSLTAVLHSKHAWVISQKFWLGLFFPNATIQIEELPTLQVAFLCTEFSLPLLIFLSSALLLIFSLGRHTQQMKNTAQGTRHPNMSVHVNVLLSILSFLILYLSQYMIGALVFFQISKVGQLFFLIAMFVVGSYPSGHSIILILGNPKLKQSAKKLLLHSKCRR
ncbi:PREDICTED: taste receptor type 2 member 1 [Hipposideros armiger]|uniref:Taste receptor type 2 n=1 Tax=Hipposideros armiger TaxID=186990 RepID=A0A8B7SX03_HIPAR|nr:PREDICTED: taste receptor type 2 member 1 [Hipposideros armiger]